MTEKLPEPNYPTRGHEIWLKLAVEGWANQVAIDGVWIAASSVTWKVEASKYTELTITLPVLRARVEWVGSAEDRKANAPSPSVE